MNSLLRFLHQIGVQILPGTIPRWKAFIRFKDGIGPALTGQLLALMTPVTMVGNLVVSGVTSVAGGVSSVVGSTAGWIWGNVTADNSEQKTNKSATKRDNEESPQQSNVTHVSTTNTNRNNISDTVNVSEVSTPHMNQRDQVDSMNRSNAAEPNQTSPSKSKHVTMKVKDEDKGNWGLASSVDWVLSFFIKKHGNKKKKDNDDDDDEHDEDDIHDKNSIKSVYSVWIPIYGTLYYTVSTPKAGKDKKYSYEELSYELDSVKHQATLEKLLSDKILIEEKAALVVYLLVDGLTKVPFAATISKKIAMFILSNLGRNVRNAYNWIADNEDKDNIDKH